MAKACELDAVEAAEVMALSAESFVVVELEQALRTAMLETPTSATAARSANVRDMFFLSWKLPIKGLTRVVVSKTVCACAIAVGYIVAKTENCIYIAHCFNGAMLKK